MKANNPIKRKGMNCPKEFPIEPITKGPKAHPARVKGMKKNCLKQPELIYTHLSGISEYILKYFQKIAQLKEFCPHYEQEKPKFIIPPILIKNFLKIVRKKIILKPQRTFHI